MTGSMRNPKSIRILLVQPPSTDRETLLRLLQRVGFLTEVSWPPAPQLYEFSDVVFVAFRAIVEDGLNLRWNRENPQTALVALLDFENPAVVSEAIRLNAHAVLGMPIRSFGVVANIFIALENFEVQTRLFQQVKNLKARIESDRLLANAKEVLMRTHAISEEEAHRALRTHAMNKRVSIVDVARSITNSDELFSSLEKRTR